MTARGVYRTDPPLVRPYVDGPSGGDPGPDPAPPSADPLAEVHPDYVAVWQAGRYLVDTHRRSDDASRCLGCGSTEQPHCGDYHVGYNMVRGALRRPGSIPLLGP